MTDIPRGFLPNIPRLSCYLSPRSNSIQGNLAVTHLMLAMPELSAATVWQAIVWRDDGSWNQTVLVLPLEDTPIGNQLGETLICDRAFSDQIIASPTDSNALTIKT